MNKILKKQNKILLLFICMATLFMSIGYATINSITLDIEGITMANPQEGIYIYDAEYKSSKNADINSSSINNLIGTNMSSYIKLSEEKDSEITYTISIYNSTDVSYYFDKVIYLEMENGTTYSNKNITYELTNLQHKDILLGKKSVTFDITFSYLDKENIVETDLTSLLNFRFISIENSVTVYLDARGGTTTQDNLLASAGDTYNQLPIPFYENYTFDGWYTEISGGVKYDENTTVSLDDNLITLYARWIAKPIAINNVPTITMSKEEAKEYYGQIVDNINGTEFNPNSSDSRTWRIFYIDTENKYGDGKGTIYLKADEVTTQKMRFSTTFEDTDTSGYTSKFTALSNTYYYKISGNDVVDSSGNVINTLYLKLNPTYATGRKGISTTIFYENEKAAAYLCDSTQFTAYTDSRTNYAVGSPPIEMWIDSWNAVHGSDYTFHYQYNVNVNGTTGQQSLPGYQLKLNDSSWDQAAGVDEIDTNSVAKNTMYKTSIGMWYASPAIVYQGGSLIRLSSVGFIGNATINTSYGFSPVVSLNSQSLVYTTTYSE